MHTFKISGSALLSTFDEIMSGVSEYDTIAADIKSSLENEDIEPIRCTGCNGNFKCRFCDSDGSCHVCFGLADIPAGTLGRSLR